MFKILYVIMAMILSLTMGGVALAGPPVDGNPDHDSVSNYAIVSATQTGASQVTVRVQANFCFACDPNAANNVGCPAFTHGYPPPPANYWCGGIPPDPGYANGRFVAVKLSDSIGVLGMTKLVCNPTNWPMAVDYQADITVDTSTPMAAGTMVTVEADIFCSWCGHWYPAADEIEIEDVIPPEVSCVEWTNPHGQKIPPAGSTTLPGAKGGQNEDGFCLIVATDIGDPEPHIKIGTACDNMLWELSASEIVIKFTEAPGATPSIKKMGSDKGQGGAVDYHITLPSEPVIKAIDAAGLESECIGCLVPPLPK